MQAVKAEFKGVQAQQRHTYKAKEHLRGEEKRVVDKCALEYVEKTFLSLSAADKATQCAAVKHQLQKHKSYRVVVRGETPSDALASRTLQSHFSAPAAKAASAPAVAQSAGGAAEPAAAAAGAPAVAQSAGASAAAGGSGGGRGAAPSATAALLLASAPVSAPAPPAAPAAIMPAPDAAAAGAAGAAGAVQRSPAVTTLMDSLTGATRNPV